MNINSKTAGILFFKTILFLLSASILFSCSSQKKMAKEQPSDQINEPMEKRQSAELEQTKAVQGNGEIKKALK